MAGKINKKLEQLKKNLTPERIAKQAYPVFRENTPIKSGNARRNTHLRGNTVQGDYPYAVPLDQGRSDQSPDGMFKPTVEFIEKYIAKQTKRG
jgi:hypothetical protein